MTAHSFAAFAEHSEFAHIAGMRTARHYFTLWPRAALKYGLGTASEVFAAVRINWRCGFNRNNSSTRTWVRDF